MRSPICPQGCGGCWYGWLTTFLLLCLPAIGLVYLIWWLLR